MPLRFWWKPNNTPVATTANRVAIGLEVGGDDATLTAPTAGRIRLLEVGGSGSSQGASETRTERLVAVFHGTFHRTPSAPLATRITFEINLGTGTVPANSGDVVGFDPECMLGVDALVLTFLNREFQIDFPFMVDRRSEGDFLEFQAVAEIGSGTSARELRRSAVLNLRVRRRHEVETTTVDPAGGGNMRYTGRVIGNLILHHEDYLVQGAFKNASAAWPATVSAEFIPIRLAAPFQGTDHRLPFQPYVSGSLTIVLMNDLLEDFLPDDAFLRGEFPRQTDLGRFRTQLEDQVKATVRRSLTGIFTNAGFSGMQALWENESAAATLISSFTGAFRRRTVGGKTWELRNSSAPLATSFWNFFVTLDDTITPVGEGGIATTDTVSTHGSREYLLSHPLPIGSGTKKIEEPVRIRTAFFNDKITTDANGGARHYASRTAFDDELDVMARKMTIIVAHEVAHNLGMMHEMKILNSGPYDESAGSPVLTIMSSSTDTSTFGVDMTFSNQAKVIWQQAFGVTPDFTDTFLRNKTWTDAEVLTLAWQDRRNRLFRLHHEIGMSRPLLVTMPGQTPPFVPASPAVQRGTHR